jgi:hypothetical protein
VAREFPRYLEAYEQAYAERSRLSGRYRDRMEALLDRLRLKYGLADGPGSGRGEPRQLGLFVAAGGEAASAASPGFRYRRRR